MKPNKKYYALAALLAVIIFFFYFMVQNRGREAYDVTESAMSTVVNFHLYGKKLDELKNGLMRDLNSLENDLLSWRVPESQVAKLNANAGERIEVDSRLKGWLDRIKEIERDSGGALDITIAPVARLWDIESEHPGVPKDTELKEALAKVNYENVMIDGGDYFRLAKGTQVDLGAVGKGIACEALAYTMWHRGACSGTVSIGGSIAVVGKKPGETAWKLGIQNPRGQTGEIMGTLTINDKFYLSNPVDYEPYFFLSTSGDYEKYFMEDGQRYHHIFDARTGYPADSGLISVTIVSDSGLESDALSTACFVLGLEQGKKLAEQYGAQAIFIDEQKQVTITDGLKDVFQITNPEYQWKQ